VSTEADKEPPPSDSATDGDAGCLVGMAGGILGVLLGGACGLLWHQAERAGGVYEIAEVGIILNYLLTGSVVGLLAGVVGGVLLVRLLHKPK
jgi:hypothetical protein